MTIISELINNGSSSGDLHTKQCVIREVVAYTPTVCAFTKTRESLPYSPDYSAEINPALTQMWGPNDAIWFNFATMPSASHIQPRPEVIESLYRSLEENADVWMELSKY
jgi:hypothetical protein